MYVAEVAGAEQIRSSAIGRAACPAFSVLRLRMSSTHRFKLLFALSLGTFEHRQRYCSMSLTNDSPEQAARAAKISSRRLATLSTEARNAALVAVHDALLSAKDLILAANARDLELAKKSAASGELSPSILKRLDLGRKGKFDDMLQGIRDVRGLEDPGRCFLEPVRQTPLYYLSLKEALLLQHRQSYHTTETRLRTISSTTFSVSLTS